MGARKTSTLSKVLELSIPERIIAVEDIWDSIADEPERVPVTTAQKVELDRRMGKMAADRSAVSTWAETKRRIRSSRSR